MSGITKSGWIFSGASNAIAKASDQAIAESLDFGIGLIRAETPIVSGDLRRGWYSDRNTIQNKMPYAAYVEDGDRYFEGRGMVRRSIGAIEKHLAGQLGKRIEGL